LETEKKNKTPQPEVLLNFSLEKQTQKPVKSAATLERLFFLTATCKYAQKQNVLKWKSEAFNEKKKSTQNTFIFDKNICIFYRLS